MIKETLLQLLEYRYRQGLKKEKPSGSVTKFKPIVFEGFVEIELRRYAGFEGLNLKTGKKGKVPPRFLVSIKADKKMFGYLNGTKEKIEPIRVKESFKGIDLIELLECFTQAREKLLKGEKAKIPGVKTLGVRKKEAWTGQKGIKVLVDEEGFSRECHCYEDSPKPKKIKTESKQFDNELNQRLGN